MQINGDLIPISSGLSHLGIDGSAGNAFDITTLVPFGNIHLNSGIFHDPLLGQSGVVRYSRASAAFQISVDGGLTFNNLATAGGTVTSIGQIGGADLVGNVDLATKSSGFFAITDSAGVSPLLFSVDNLGLSGLWRFPTQGFNGSVVNSLTDANGTTAQGVINVVGASGIVVDIIGQIMTITPGNTLPRCFAATFGSAVTWTVTHNLNSTDVSVSVYDAGSPASIIIPDRIRTTSVNVVTITFNAAQAGRAVIFAAF